MGKLLMKHFLTTTVLTLCATFCFARELYVTNNWQNACIKELYYAADNTKAIPHKTKVHFRHDGKNLIIRAVMDVKKDYPFPALTNRNGTWPSSESIEIFIDPGADGKGYYQIAVGMNGDRFDNRYVKKTWKANWKSQVKHASGQWIAEITIPYPAKTNFCSGFNFCRNVKNDGEYYSTWAKVGAIFHNPGKFGKLYLGSKADVDKIVRKAEFERAGKLKVKARKLKVEKEFPHLFANQFNMQKLQHIADELEIIEAMQNSGIKQ